MKTHEEFLKRVARLRRKRNYHEASLNAGNLSEVWVGIHKFELSKTTALLEKLTC